MMRRRSFLAGGSAVLAGVAAGVRRASAAEAAADGAPTFSTGNRRWQAAYDRALAVLAGNIRILPRVSAPVLIEGSTYRGIWQECGPHEAMLYRKFRPDVARNGHLVFFDLQRADGQLPASNKETETGFGQIQMVVPIAATAWELARSTGDGALLERAYRACSAWDSWLLRYRNTRGTGLVEGFCAYDSGHDNSPRWAGLPNQCPDKDARRHHPIASLPRLCPDLSATVYGARIALAQMARALGRAAESDRWTESAEAIRSLILSKLYVPDEAAFYDLDAQDRFVRVRGDLMTRICGEHVVDQARFDEIWTRQLHDPKAFWAPFPLPSIALDDPSFVRPIPPNSWGGASQALTAMRAGRWFDHYDRAAEFTFMMDRWCEAIQADPSMRQQMDPLTGAFTHGADAPDYSPTALVMVDYSWRLIGVREEADTLQWNVRPRHPAAASARLAMRTDEGRSAAMAYRNGSAELRLAGRRVATVEGGAVRVVTDKAGHPLALLGIEPSVQALTLRLGDGRLLHVRIGPNQTIPLAGPA